MIIRDVITLFGMYYNETSDNLRGISAACAFYMSLLIATYSNFEQQMVRLEVEEAC